MRRGLLSLLAVALCARAAPVMGGDFPSSLNILDDRPSLRPTLQPQSEGREDAAPIVTPPPMVFPPVTSVRLRVKVESLGEGSDRDIFLREEAGDSWPERGGPAEIFVQTPAIFEANRIRGLVDARAALAGVWKVDPELWRLKEYWSLRSGFEVDFAPSGDTLFYARSFYLAAFNANFAEIKPGFAAPDGLSPFPALGKLYVGPFAILNGLRRDQPTKLGLHFTLSKIGLFDVTMACGYARDRFTGSGAFALVETSFRF